MRLLPIAILASSALSAAVSFESEVKPIFEKHCVEYRPKMKSLPQRSKPPTLRMLRGVENF